MRILYYIGLAAPLACVPLGAARPEVAPAAQRSSVIRAVNDRMRPPVYAHPQEDIYKNNPFAPNKHIQAEEEAAPIPHGSDEEFVAKLAAQLAPTGVFIFGDQTFLLFGEKKVKVGDTILIPFDNNSYEVELIGLTRTSFTVRLNQAEVSRSIKPAKQP